MKLLRTVTCRTALLGWPVAIFLLIGCSEEGTPTDPNPAPSTPSAAGTWKGICVTDYGPTGLSRQATLTANISQIGPDLGGVCRWINYREERTLYYFKGRLTVSREISVEETSFVPENWSAGEARDELLQWTGTLSTGEDSIQLTNVLPPNESYPRRTLTMVRSQ